MNIRDKRSETLAAEVVAFRVLGFNREAAIAAMQELARRESEGDQFKYEQFIAKEVADQPERPTLPEVKDGLGELFSVGLSMVKK